MAAPRLRKTRRRAGNEPARASARHAAEPEDATRTGQTPLPDAPSLDPGRAGFARNAAAVAEGHGTRGSEPRRAQIVAGIQQSFGNHYVARLLEHVAGATPRVQRQEGAEEELTEQEETEWLQAKRLQRKPAGDVARMVDPAVQRAWTGRRQLQPLSWLGKPWVVNKSSNIVNLRLYHEHIFFEDGGKPPDWGHMGKQGLDTDTDKLDQYSKVRENLDDERMRWAVTQIGDPGAYSLFSNNCQDYVQSVLAKYDSDEQHAIEMQ